MDPKTSLAFTHKKDDRVSQKSPTHIRVMTYNVHGFKDKYQRKKITDIVNVITEICPDILVLEEVYIYKRNETISEKSLMDMLEKSGLNYSAFSTSGANAVFSNHPFVYTEIDLGKDSKYKISRN